MSENISRRSFLKRVGAAAAVGSATGMVRAAPAFAAPVDENVGILVDLTKCDGCPDVPVPRCTTACQTENETRYPEPRDEDVKDYWPQTKHEDWRAKRNLKTTLTPYNWTYVQKIKVEHGDKGKSALSRTVTADKFTDHNMYEQKVKTIEQILDIFIL